MPIRITLKGLCTFFRNKTQCPQIDTKLTQFEDNDSRKLPVKYYLLRCFRFLEMSKTIYENYFSMYNVLSWHCFTHFSKTTAPQCYGKLSIILCFKWCKLNGNLSTLCFVSYKKYPDPLRGSFFSSDIYISIGYAKLCVIEEEYYNYRYRYNHYFT